MKRAKVILAVCFVIIVVALLSRDNGLIRTMFSGADTEAIAGPQESTPEAEASASAAKDGDEGEEQFTTLAGGEVRTTDQPGREQGHDDIHQDGGNRCQAQGSGLHMPLIIAYPKS